MRRALAAVAVLVVAACLTSQDAGPPPVPASAADLAGKIVYVGYDDELWIARPDGSERRRLNPADASQFTVVGDARPDGPFRAWPIGATGHLHDFPQPVWSPTRDVFAATDVFHVPHVHHLWLGGPSAASLRLLDEARPHFLNVAWSVDGAVLLLALDELHAWKLYWVDTGQSVELFEGGMWPDWCCRTPTVP